MTAPWQIYFYIVPDTVYDKHIPFSIRWKNPDIFYSIDTYFKEELWKTEGINENIVQYGNISETCIEIHEKNNEYAVMLSIDLRRVTEEFLNTVCEFCAFRNALILTPDNILRKATYKTLINLIIMSEAARFCMYVEPYLARRRDEYDYNRTYWWEALVPSSRKLYTSEEKDSYIIDFCKKLKNGEI